MRKIIYLIFLIALSCGKEKNIPTNFDYGQVVRGNIYKNDYFSMQVQFDPSWILQSRKEMARLTNTGKDLISGDDKQLSKVLDASLISVAELFMVFKYELGSIAEFNPSFLINAENLKMYPSVKDPKDYLVQAKKLFESTKMNYVYRQDDYNIKIGGVDFICMPIENLDYNIYQDYFVTIKNGFALAMIVSYDNENDKKELYAIIDKVNFENQS
jgi:hypothetical protein